MGRKIESIPFLDILKNAWKLAWKNRSLWWYGFLMIFSVPGFFQFSNFYSYVSDEKNGFPQAQRENILNFIHQNEAWLIVVGVFFSILFIIFLVLGVIGFGALVFSIEKKIQNQETTFMIGIREGVKNFWKIFLIRLFLFLLLFFVIILLVIPIVVLFVSSNIVAGVILSLLAILIFILAIILIGNVSTFASLYAILGKLDFWQSIKSGYDLFMKNTLACIIMGLLFIPAGLVLSIASMLIFLLILMIFALVGVIFYLIAGWYGTIIPIIFGILTIIIFSYLSRSIYIVFTQSAWVMFFYEIAKPKEEAMTLEIQQEQVSIEKAMPMIECKKK